MPLVGGLTSGLTGSDPLSTVTNTAGGLTGGSAPLGAVGGVTSTVTNTAGSGESMPMSATHRSGSN